MGESTEQILFSRDAWVFLESALFMALYATQRDGHPGFPPMPKFCKTQKGPPAKIFGTVREKK